jgi:hypothetical protein
VSSSISWIGAEICFFLDAFFDLLASFPALACLLASAFLRTGSGLDALDFS